MSDRPDLALDAAEMAAFLAGHTEAVVGEIGPDGYPTARVVPVHYADGALWLGAGAPATGTAVCAIVDEGATYDDIVAAVVRGEIGTDGRLPLDHVVSFAFAKIPS
jgi:hypothetical protein